MAITAAKNRRDGSQDGVEGRAFSTAAGRIGAGRDEAFR
jgi:hypothetical protein